MSMCAPPTGSHESCEWGRQLRGPDGQWSGTNTVVPAGTSAHAEIRVPGRRGSPGHESEELEHREPESREPDRRESNQPGTGSPGTGFSGVGTPRAGLARARLP